MNIPRFSGTLFLKITPTQRQQVVEAVDQECPTLTGLTTPNMAVFTLMDDSLLRRLAARLKEIPAILRPLGMRKEALLPGVEVQPMDLMHVFKHEALNIHRRVEELTRKWTAQPGEEVLNPLRASKG